ncbi:MAG: hypothetical protein ACRCXX_13955 [Cetobacterium sp.]|uniref:hypothetical protein n=1 Tax=Cetobacterium sp. TaxID=2071632 RepID=UPI003F2D3BD0
MTKRTGYIFKFINGDDVKFLHLYRGKLCVTSEIDQADVFGTDDLNTLLKHEYVKPTYTLEKTILKNYKTKVLKVERIIITKLAEG